MLVLNDLRDKPKSRKAYKRVGRGKHNSPGHGGKGQTARTGVALGNFQGGQTPTERRLPKIGKFFTKPKMATVALKNIDRLIDNGHISADVEINYDILKFFNLIKKVKKYKLVGECENKINIVSDGASQNAIASIKKAGGSWQKTDEV
jgi:large subunit ribosomal protein L15